jgi:thioredoxin reductase (NADPH)
MISGLDKGGQLTTTTEVENFPGFPDGIDGTELVERMEAQARRFGTEIIEQDVVEVSLDGDLKRISTDAETHLARAVIIATGASAKYLGHPDEQKFKGRGVSACATCDGYFYKNKPVVVIGGGDTAFGEALYLSKIASEVTLVARSTEFKASTIMVQRVKATPNITIFAPYELEAIKSYDNHEPLTIRDVWLKHATKAGSGARVPARGVFVAIGHRPNTELFKGQLGLDPAGYIVCVNGDHEEAQGTTLTGVDGVFACGDVIDPHYRQAITAAGSGCIAALEAQRYLEEQR